MPRAKGNNNNKLFLHPKDHSTPCKDCPDRSPYCHGSCAKYCEYKHLLNETKLDREYGLHGNYGRFRDGLRSEVKQYDKG